MSSRTTFEVIKKTTEKDSEEGAPLETPLQRYERLRAEISGFLRDIENIRNIRAQGSDSGVFSAGDDLDGVNLVELAERLKIWQSQLQAASKQDSGFESIRGGARVAAQSELTTQLMGKISALKSGVAESGEDSAAKGVVAYELVYRKDAAKEMKMAQVAELERRLATLEQVVTGRVAPEPEMLSGQQPAKGLVANVDDVRHKVTSLDERAMEQLSHRMVKLTKHFEALNAARQITTSSSSSSSDPSSSTLPTQSSSSSSSSPLSPEQETKIDSVYKCLSQVEVVSSELPVVVERLVQLRALHEQAVQFASQLSSISSSQTELSSALQANLSGINRMQESLTKNMATIEKNVLALEKRIADVSTLLSK